jgi:hypothetical protein
MHACTDDDIRKKIYEDMMNLAMHEAGTGWMRLGTLLSGSSTDQMLGAGFKARARDFPPILCKVY